MQIKIKKLFNTDGTHTTIEEYIMNNWDKVEKRKRAATDADIHWEYVKMGFMFLFIVAFIYFLFK